MPDHPAAGAAADDFDHQHRYPRRLFLILQFPSCFFLLS
jgi:hypothetical protein